MLIFGRWQACDDGIVRPIIEGEVLSADGATWEPTEFLADVGADRTVFNAEFLTTLALPQLTAFHQLGGVGGAASTVVIRTQIRFALDGGRHLIMQGSFAGFTNPSAIDMNILGRDITNLFALIVDRQGDVVCMIGKGHQYAITTQL